MLSSEIRRHLSSKLKELAHYKPRHQSTPADIAQQNGWSPPAKGKLIPQNFINLDSDTEDEEECFGRNETMSTPVVSAKWDSNALFGSHRGHSQQEAVEFQYRYSENSDGGDISIFLSPSSTNTSGGEKRISRTLDRSKQVDRELFRANDQLDQETQALVRHYVNGQNSHDKFLPMFEKILEITYGEFTSHVSRILDSHQDMQSEDSTTIVDDGCWWSPGTLETQLRLNGYNVLKYSKEQMYLYGRGGLSKYLTKQLMLGHCRETELLEQLEQTSDQLERAMDQIDVLRDALQGTNLRELRQEAAHLRDRIDRIQADVEETSQTRRIYQDILNELTC